MLRSSHPAEHFLRHFDSPTLNLFLSSISLYFAPGQLYHHHQTLFYSSPLLNLYSLRSCNSRPSHPSSWTSKASKARTSTTFGKPRQLPASFSPKTLWWFWLGDPTVRAQFRNMTNRQFCGNNTSSQQTNTKTKGNIEHQHVKDGESMERKDGESITSRSTKRGRVRYLHHPPPIANEEAGESLLNVEYHRKSAAKNQDRCQHHHPTQHREKSQQEKHNWMKKITFF